MAPARRRSARALVGALGALTHRFDPPARAAKLRALAALARCPVTRGADLLRLHETLCFMAAYPDDPRVLGRVEAELAGFAARVSALTGRQAAALEETGVAGTVVYWPGSYAAARWLAARWGAAVELDADDPSVDQLLAVLLPHLLPALADQALVEVGVPYRRWLGAGTGADRPSGVGGLFEQIERRPALVATARVLWDVLQPRLAWRLHGAGASRTLARVAGRGPFFHRGPLRGRGGPLSRRLPGPPLGVRRAGPAEARTLLDAARAAMVLRYRETYAFTHADPGDVTVASAGRGLEIVWVGLPPAFRLPLRAHYGYLLLKGGLPVGYGDASLLFDWCEIAFNVFEAFRRGESGFALARLLGFVWRALGARVFRLAPFQLGHDNPEAIASGAFWFYAKLGFQPVRPDLARLAAAERERIAREPGYRSSTAVLRRLAGGPAVLVAGGGMEPGVARFETARVARRAAGRPTAPARLAARLGADDWRRWPAAERSALARLAAVLGTIPDLDDWSAAERRALAAIVRAKGGGHESVYLRRLQRHGRLRAALLRLGQPEGQPDGD